MSVAAPPVAQRVIVDTVASLEGMVDVLSRVPRFAWDHETRSANFSKDPDGALKLLTMKTDLISFAAWVGEDLMSWVVPTHMVVLPHLPEQAVFDAIRPMMQDRHILHLGWNVKYDCLLGDTEVLTPAGWVQLRVATKQKNLVVATWEEAGNTLSFSKAKPIINENDFRPIVSAETAHVSLRMTEAHRCPVFSRTSNDPEFRFQVLAGKDIRFGGKTRIPVGGTLTGPECTSFTPAEVRLVVSAQADGCIDKKSWAVIWSFQKPRKINRLRAMLVKEGYSFSEHEYEASKYAGKFFTVFRCSDPRLKAAVAHFLTPEKRFKLAPFLYPALAQAAVDEVQYWDATTTQGRVVYSSKHRENVDVIHTLCHLVGKRAYVTTVPGTTTGLPHYYLGISNRSYSSAGAEKGYRAISQEPNKEGRTYCVTVPSGFILIRHNGKICVTGNCHAMANYNVWVANVQDVMLKGFLLAADQPNGLKERCADVGMELHKFDFKTLWKAQEQLTSGVVPKRKAPVTREAVEALEKEYRDYGGDDSVATLLLDDLYQPKLEAMPKMHRFFTTVKNRSVRTIFNMERRGIRTDKDYLLAQAAVAQKDIEKAEKQIYQTAGKHFNIGSTKELGQVLYEELGLPVVTLTPNGANSTAAGTLDALAQAGHKIAYDLAIWRKVSKMLTTYFAPDSSLVEQIYSWGYLHPTFNVSGARTGRLSSSAPNAQNFPKNLAKNYFFRKAIVASEGHIIVGGDWSQIELRMMGHSSRDPTMCGEYCRDLALQQAIIDNLDVKTLVKAGKITKSDIHRATANACNATRDLAKVINFGLLYGMGAGSLARVLTEANWDACIEHGTTWDPQRDVVTQELAAEFKRKFFSMYPYIKVYQDAIAADVAKKGYIETRFGHRRPLPDIYANDPFLRWQAGSQACNTSIQGAVGELALYCMNNVEQVCPEAPERVIKAGKRLRKNKYRLFSQIHDEVLGECPDSEDCATQCRIDLAEIFQRPFDPTESFPHYGYRLPLVFEPLQGYAWSDVHG